jgi:hypothetical protein
MTLISGRRSILFLSLFVLSAALFSVSAQPLRISTEPELVEQLKKGPCENKDRLESVRELFLHVGADETEIRIDSFRNVENLVVSKKGKTAETVIVGAHYDKVGDGCGVIDNWSGIVILANLYRTLKPIETEKSYLFVAFGKEEVGLVGSGAMARSIPKNTRESYCAMINFDSFGMGVPQVLTNVSDKKLTVLAEEVSSRLDLPFGKQSIDSASSDSASFRSRGIPAITLHGLGDKWADTIHSSNDKFEKIEPNSVYLGYRHGLVMLTTIDANPCNSFRK